ncbi:MAG TPA: HAMP domain-containing sensor histidine kinase [Candidatus Fimivivens sp.]|nr:HAMP domain-containing sensor histidine kinase [Candidatus Fimivivens sp.]
MGYNLVTNLESCYTSVPHLLYYSHVPTAIATLLFGIFVFLMNREKNVVVGRLLLLVSVAFVCWAISDIVIFVNPDSRKIMLLWSLVNLFELLVSSGTLYFSYVFLEKKDVPFAYKILFGSLFSIYILFIPTAFNLTGFDGPNCEAGQGVLMKYYYFLETYLLSWTVIYLFRNIIRSQMQDRRYRMLFAVGAICFLASFSGTNIVSSITGKWEILQYGLFGMPVFLGFLTYLIVQYRAFSIKLLGAQALVVALVALIGSQFFFIQNETNKVLTAITLVISVVFGWILIRSVRKEVERKEELQRISDSLATANQRLKELDNTKTEFISIASHQLRTPLTAIKGYLSLLLEGSYGAVSADVRDVLEKVNLVNRNLIGLVEDLLNVSRIDAGRIRYTFLPTGVETLVTDKVSMFMPLAREKGIELSAHVPETPLPKLSLDAGKIGESLSNLIDNALKYTDAGSVRVSVELSGEGVRITVTDTGIGLKPEDLAKLFEKFVRTEETTKRYVSGTGLGLYVGRSFVTAHGGHMWAESEGIGKGSRFIIELPIRNPRENGESGMGKP